MYIGVKDVKPLKDYKLLLEFENGKRKIFDITPYLEIGAFKALRDEKLFNSVKVSFDTIEWDNHLDLDPEILYTKAKEI